MKALFKKEIRYFFTSAIGYVVIGAFMLFCSLFLWVLSGDYNIWESGFASFLSFSGLDIGIPCPRPYDAYYFRGKTQWYAPIAFYISY